MPAIWTAPKISALPPTLRLIVVVLVAVIVTFSANAPLPATFNATFATGVVLIATVPLVPSNFIYINHNNTNSPYY